TWIFSRGKAAKIYTLFFSDNPSTLNVDLINLIHMNKVYKLRFSKAQKELIVTSELATAADQGSAASSVQNPNTTKTSSKKFSLNPLAASSLVAGLGATLSLGMVGTSAHATGSRTGMDVVSGSAVVSTLNNYTAITTSTDKTILNWNTFNIDTNEIVEFIQKSSNSVVLNRILGGSVSQILGTLKSNGAVFIVNPTGIVFGANSTVDVNSLVASTLDIADNDFLNGKYVFNQDKDKAIATVLSQGVIKVKNDGTLALVGGNVVNTGALEAKNGTVYLLASNSITISDLTNPNITYTVTAKNRAVNLGEIIGKNVVMAANKVANGYTSATEFADIMSNYGASASAATITASGEVLLYGASENVTTNLDSNTTSASSINASNNTGLAVNNGTINVANASCQGGTVKVLGDNVVLENNSLINASGATGGEVYIGGDFKGTGDLKLANTTYVSNGSVVNVSGTGNAGKIAV
ncbi:two-partner secretion domain-containing protein, partial [Psittacicella hinzii]